MTRARIGILFALLLIVGLIGWLIYMNSGNLMDVKVASSNGSNYSLQVPPEMKPGYFNDNASFQYTNETANYSFMVIDDSKEKIASFGLDYDLDTYMKIATRSLDSAGMYVNTKIEVSKMPALQATIKGKRDGAETTFILTCVETPRFYYQLVCWSPSDKFELNKPALEGIINSFTEENPQPVNP